MSKNNAYHQSTKFKLMITYNAEGTLTQRNKSNIQAMSLKYYTAN